MLVLIAFALALIPAVAILYPFVRRPVEEAEDEGSTRRELSRMWDAAVVGLKNAELERAVGNLTEQDYRWLKEEYMTEAARAMKAMGLDREQEQDLIEALESEVRAVRSRVLGVEGEPEDGDPGG